MSFEVFSTRYYNACEAAKILGLAPQKVRELARAGKMTYVKGLHRGMKFSDSDLRRYIASLQR